MHYTEQIELLKRRLLETLPGVEAQNKMASRVRPLPNVIPENARMSAVLALLFPIKEVLHLLLIKRIEDGKAHSGQISFPGGRKDEQDANLQITALRETFEEVGVPSEQIEMLGGLTPLYIPVSNSNVYPFVGFAAEQPQYNLSMGEVAYVLELPLSELWHEAKKTVKHITPSAFPDITIKAPAYEWDNNHIIWGATAMMIAELEEIFPL